jgi:hypothetical protein
MGALNVKLFLREPSGWIWRRNEGTVDFAGRHWCVGPASGLRPAEVGDLHLNEGRLPGGKPEERNTK